MDSALSLRIGSTMGNTHDKKIPSLAAATGVATLSELLSTDGTLSGVTVQRLEYFWFQEGFRPCDTLVIYRNAQRQPLWKLAPCGVLRTTAEKRSKRTQQTRGLKVEKISISAIEFWEITRNLCNWLQPSKYRLNAELECVKVNENGAEELYDLLKRGHTDPPSSKLAKIFDRYVGLFFHKGHKFGKPEQAVMSMQLMLLSFTDLQSGLISTSTEFAKFWILNSLGDSMTLTKQYKAWTTNREHHLFEFIGTTPNDPEKVLPIWQVELDQFFLHNPVFRHVGRDGLDKKVFETTSKWLQYFLPSRTLPCPDDTGVAAEYNKYIGFLTTREHIGTHATKEQVREWSDGPIGTRTEDFLSACLATQIADSASKYPKGKASKVLKGESTPEVPLGTSSNYQSSRRKGGHYGTNAEEIIPFLKMKIGEVFPFIMELEDGTEYICDDHGQPLCPLEFGDQSIWRVAFADTNEFDEVKEILTKPGGKNVKSDFFGLDLRYGSFIYLYATFGTREWRDAIHVLREEHGYDDLDFTEDQLRELCSLHKLILPMERTVPVLEPGGKTRWVSAAEAALLYYQYPLAEDLRTLYTEIESARVGLTQDNPLFRFEQSFADHTLNKMLQPRDDGLTPQQLKDVKDDILSQGGTDLDVEVEFTLLVALALASSHKVHPLASLASLCPRGDSAFHRTLLDALKDERRFYHAQVKLEDCKSYRDVDKLILENDSLVWQILVITTTDMVKATDTFLHSPLRRNLTSVLKHLKMI